jgi:hypothetical protein
VGLAREPGHITDPGQPGSTRRAYPMQVSQGRAGSPEQRAEFFADILLALAGPFQVADQLGGVPRPQHPAGGPGPAAPWPELLTGPSWPRRRSARAAADAAGTPSGYGLPPATGGGRPGPASTASCRYADRHGGRALTPVMIMGTSGLKRA